MKKVFLMIAIAMASGVSTMAQTNSAVNTSAQATTEKLPEWKIVTVVESIIPMGLGRSRMIENTTEVNTEQFRTSRTDGKKSDQNSVSRSELKVENFDEAKLLNFF